MAQTNNNLVSSAKCYSENRYSEFTTLFRIPFKETPFEEVYKEQHNRYVKVLRAWAEVCIRALEMRMDSCVAMLFRNRENVLISNEIQIVFRKSNGQLHSFNHPSFKMMEELIQLFNKEDWKAIACHTGGIRQLLKALYWIPEEDKKERNSFGFGQLISCLEEFTIVPNNELPI